MKTTSKLYTGLAVAFAMVAGEASAATVIKNVNANLTGGGAAYSGQFDLSAYLDGGAYKIVNAKITATGGSNPQVKTTSTTSPPQFDHAVKRVITEGHIETYNCLPFFGCDERWVPEVAVWDETYKVYHQIQNLDLVKDTLRIDAGEGVGLGTVGLLASNDTGWLDKGQTQDGSQQFGWNYYEHQERTVTSVWAGPVSASALLSLADLAALNASGVLDFKVDSTVGQVFAQRVQLDFDVVSAVPEPATWAMMLAGFFGVGQALRARRRQGLAV